MSKQNLTLFFAILAAGLFGMTFVAAVFLIKEILYSPRPETPESYRTAPICDLEKLKAQYSTSTPESQIRPKESQKEPFKVDNQKVRESIKEIEQKLEEAQLETMSEQLKEAERQVKLLEEQINETPSP